MSKIKLVSLLIICTLINKLSSQSIVALYGQCGGIGYTGSTNCGNLAQCVVINTYYYQCLPITSPPNSVIWPMRWNELDRTDHMRHSRNLHCSQCILLPVFTIIYDVTKKSINNYSKNTKYYFSKSN